MNSALAFAIKVLSASLAFFMFVALSYAMDPRAYGVFATVFSLATFCAVVGSMGQRSNVMRFAARYDEEGLDEQRRAVTQFGYKRVAAGSSLAAMGGYVLTVALSDVPTSVIAASGFLVLTLGLGLAEYQSRAMRVSAPVSLSLVPRDVFWRLFVCVSAIIVVAIIGHESAGAQTWVWVLGGSLLLTCWFQWRVYERLFPEKTFTGTAKGEPKLWRRESRGPWVSLIVTSSGANLSVLLVGLSMPVEQAGAFFSAMKVAQLLNLFMLATEVVLIPSIARSMATDNLENVQRLCTFTALLGGTFGLAGAVFLIVFGEYLLALFNNDAVSAAPALAVLAIGFAVNTAAGPTAPLLTMSGRADDLAKYQFTGSVVFLGAMPYAVGSSGLVGAAVCVTGISVFWNLCAWGFARFRLRIDPSLLSLVYPVPRA